MTFVSFARKETVCWWHLDFHLCNVMWLFRRHCFSLILFLKGENLATSFGHYKPDTSIDGIPWIQARSIEEHSCYNHWTQDVH